MVTPGLRDEAYFVKGRRFPDFKGQDDKTSMSLLDEYHRQNMEFGGRLSIKDRPGHCDPATNSESWLRICRTDVFGYYVDKGCAGFLSVSKLIERDQLSLLMIHRGFLTYVGSLPGEIPT